VLEDRKLASAMLRRVLETGVAALPVCPALSSLTGRVTGLVSMDACNERNIDTSPIRAEGHNNSWRCG
jgi:hypothetical protein